MIPFGYNFMLFKVRSKIRDFSIKWDKNIIDYKLDILYFVKYGTS